LAELEDLQLYWVELPKEYHPYFERLIKHPEIFSIKTQVEKSCHITVSNDTFAAALAFAARIVGIAPRVMTRREIAAHREGLLKQSKELHIKAAMGDRVARFMAQQLDAEILALRDPGPLLLGRYQRNPDLNGTPQVRGTQIIIAEAIRKLFGQPCHGSAARLTQIALGLPKEPSRRISRTALERRTLGSPALHG
jgi:hypothetical protein